MRIAALAGSVMSNNNLRVDILSIRGVACSMQSALATAAHTHLFGYTGLLGMNWALIDLQADINACKLVNHFRPALLVLREA